MKWLLLLIALSSGCALSTSRARVHLERARVDHARTIEAKRRARVPYERFEATMRAADATRDEAARTVLASEAQLWLEVAIADSERLMLAEQRLAEERALVAIDAEIIGLERARRALADENAQRAARALARDEAKRALARALQKTAQRAKLGRDDARAAALALRRQAEMIVLTLETLGRPAAELAPLHQQLAAVDAALTADPEAALDRADETLYAAQAALGALRTGADAPDALEKASLAEALAASGARVGADDLGRSATIEAAFRNAALTPAGARMLTRLCVLARAYPRGPVRITVDGADGPHLTARLRAAEKQLGDQGCSGARFVFAASGRAGELVALHWVAY